MRLIAVMLVAAAIGCGLGSDDITTGNHEWVQGVGGGFGEGGWGTGGAPGAGGDADAGAIGADACDPACAADRIYDAYVQAVADLASARDTYNADWNAAIARATPAYQGCVANMHCLPAQCIGCTTPDQIAADAQAVRDDSAAINAAKTRADDLWTAYLSAATVAGVTPRLKLT